VRADVATLCFRNDQLGQRPTEFKAIAGVRMLELVRQK
jgi:hypothetical protein